MTRTPGNGHRKQPRAPVSKETFEVRSRGCSRGCCPCSGGAAFDYPPITRRPSLVTPQRRRARILLPLSVADQSPKPISPPRTFDFDMKTKIWYYLNADMSGGGGGGSGGEDHATGSDAKHLSQRDDIE